MALLFFGCAFFCTAVIHAVLKYQLGVWVRARAFSPSMLSPMGTLFALFVAFTAAQVWSDTDRATAAVAQEASALRSVVILADAFPAESRERLETLIHRHIEEVATKEWPMMARRTATLDVVPRHLVEALQFALALMPTSQGQGVAQREITVELESALDARRQRILISQSSVSSVKWACLLIEGICVLITIALTHGGERPSALAAMGLFATAAAACFLLIAAYDRPFVGQISIRPDPLLQAMPQRSGLGLNLKQYLISGRISVTEPFNKPAGERI